MFKSNFLLLAKSNVCFCALLGCALTMVSRFRNVVPYVPKEADYCCRQFLQESRQFLPSTLDPLQNPEVSTKEYKINFLLGWRALAQILLATCFHTCICLLTQCLKILSTLIVAAVLSTLVFFSLQPDAQ